MSRTTGRCVGAAVAALPVDLEQHGRSDEAESRRPLVTAEARNAHFGEAGDAIRYLDALAAQMRACGWTAYINPPARRFASAPRLGDRDDLQRERALINAHAASR